MLTKHAIRLNAQVNHSKYIVSVQLEDGSTDIGFETQKNATEFMLDSIKMLSMNEQKFSLSFNINK